MTIDAAPTRTEAPPWPEFERRGWEQRASAYHEFFAPVIGQVTTAVLDAVAAGPGTRLLDACCGPGYLAGEAAARGAGAVGVDVAPAMALLARRLHPQASFQVGDVCALPCAAGSVDAAVCGLGIHHVAEPAAAVVELARVLRAGGLLAMTVWDDRSSQLAVVKEAVLAVSPEPPRGLPSPPPRPDYLSEAEIRGLLEPAGLRLTALTPLTASYQAADAQILWDTWLPSAIRTGPLLAAQPAEVRQAARAELERLVEPHRRADGSVSLRADLLLIVARAAGGA